MFSRGGQSNPKHHEPTDGLDVRVDELEHVVDWLEVRLDAIEATWADAIPVAPDVDGGQPSAGDPMPGSAAGFDDPGGPDAQVHVLPLAAVIVDPPAGTSFEIDEPDPRVDDLEARLDAAHAALDAHGARLDAVCHAVELLTLRLDEVLHRHDAREREQPPEPSNGHEVVIELRELQLTQAKLAVEQARVEQLFREDLAGLAERVRRLGRPLT